MLTGIRDNTTRMHAIGAPVYWRLVLIYTISATMAGVAGALLTQVSQFVGLNVLGLEPSGDVLVMLILGGVGRLYGAFIGPVAYLIAQDYLAKQYPEYWYLGIGALDCDCHYGYRTRSGGTLRLLRRWMANDPRILGSDTDALHVVAPAGRYVVSVERYFSNPYVRYEDRAAARDRQRHDRCDEESDGERSRGRGQEPGDR